MVPSSKKEENEPKNPQKKNKTKKAPHTCWIKQREMVLYTAFIAPNFFFRNQPCKHKTVKVPGTRDGSDPLVLQDTFPFAEERGKDT